MLCAAGDDQVAAVGQRSDLQRVLESLLAFDVAGNDRQRFDFQLGRIQREQDGERVVNAGVCVDDGTLGGLSEGGSK